MSQNTKSVKGYFIGFLAGGTVGAVVALLTAPKSGEKMRKEIKQKSDEYFDEVDKYFSDAKHNAGKMIDESKRKFAIILQDIKSKPEAVYKDAERVYKDAKGKTIEVFNSGKERIETEKERLAASVEAGKKTYNNEKNK